MNMFQQDAPSVYATPPFVPEQRPQAKPKGGMFGGGKFGIGEAIVAALNGYLAGTGNPVGLANMRAMQDARNQRYQSQADEDKYQRLRSDQMQDWMAQQQFKIDHPEAAAPHYFESNSGDVYSIPGRGQQPQEVFHDPFRYKLVPNGMGGVVPVDIGSLMGGPQRPVGKLTPIDEGGPMPQASGGFPRPY